LAVDSSDDADSVRQLRDTLNKVGMNMPFIQRESQVPKWYRDVLDFVHEEMDAIPGRNPTKMYKLGSAFIVRRDVTAMVQSQLSNASVPRRKSEQDIWECLSFWSDLGETFVCVCPCLFHCCDYSYTFTSGTSLCFYATLFF